MILISKVQSQHNPTTLMTTQEPGSGDFDQTLDSVITYLRGVQEQQNPRSPVMNR